MSFLFPYLDGILAVINIGKSHVAHIGVHPHVHPGVEYGRDRFDAVDLEWAFSFKDLEDLGWGNGSSVTESKAGSSCNMKLDTYET